MDEATSKRRPQFDRGYPQVQNDTKKVVLSPGWAETLTIGSWDYLEQIPTVTVTVVKATFVRMTFVHIRNISAVTYPILTKL